MPKVKNNWNRNSMPRICAIGIAVIVLMSLLMAAIAAIFILNEYLDITTGNYLAPIIQFAAAFFGVFCVGKIAQQDKVLACGIVAAACYFGNVGIGMLIFDGSGSGLILGFVACGVGSVCAYFMSTRTKKTAGSRKRRNRAR